MVLHEHIINYKYGETIKLKPIFDVHLGNRDCDVTAFKRMLNEHDEHTWYMGGGDLLDMIIASDIKRYRKSGDGTLGDAIVDEQIDMMKKLLEPVKDRIVGLGEGNHEQNILKRCATHPIKRLCKELGVKYLGYSCLVKLVFRLMDKRGWKTGGGVKSIVIRQHHGWGGGSRTRGGNITKFEKDLKNWDADIFMYGHVHQLQDDVMPRLGMKGLKLVSRPQILLIGGTYLKIFSEQPDPTYSEQAGFPPTMIGGATVHLKPNSNKWVDIHVTT